MEISRQSQVKLSNIVRYILALPVSFILFYVIGNILLLAAGWSYIAELNKFLVLPIIFIKNIVLAISLYIIMPKLKRGITTIAGIMMIALSLMTIYIYIINGTSSIASIYTMQIIIWVGIIIFIYLKLPRK
ncbi:MAG: hypothetical protein ACRCTZ_03195 [Sarcina sp.]